MIGRLEKKSRTSEEMPLAPVDHRLLVLTFYGSTQPVIWNLWTQHILLPLTYVGTDELMN
jgi:hypothetical protein